MVLHAVSHAGGRPCRRDDNGCAARGRRTHNDAGYTRQEADIPYVAQLLSGAADGRGEDIRIHPRFPARKVLRH